MNVVFRLDASKNIGMGHLSRCRNLAFFLNKKGAKIDFVLRNLDRNFKNFLNHKKYKLNYLPNNRIFNKTLNSDSEKLWPRLLQKIDAKETKKFLSKKKIEWLIVDHYGLNYRWEKDLNNSVKNIMVIDDHLNREHFCNLFLNQNFTKSSTSFSNKYLPKKCKLLLGPKYSLLDKNYSDLRKKIKIKNNKKIKNILVTFGGTNMKNLISKIISVFNCKELHKINLTIITKERHIDSLKHKKNLNQPSIKFMPLVKNLSQYILKSDFCIGAGGTTNWERMCLGVPTLVFPIAPNQVEISNNLKKKKLIYLIKNYKGMNIKNLRKKIIEIINNRKELNKTRKKCLTFIDGLGAVRLSKMLFSMKNI